MNNLNNSPWAALSGLQTLSNYTDEELKDFAARLLEGNDWTESYFKIMFFVQTLKQIKNSMEEIFLDNSPPQTNGIWTS